MRSVTSLVDVIARPAAEGPDLPDPDCPDLPDVSPESDRQRYAAVSRALADPKRLCVLEVLASGERSVGQLSRDASCQIPNMSQHLAVLRAAGLVTTHRNGNTVYYRLADPRVLEAYKLIQALAR